MIALRWLGSPLAGTAGVLAGLCLLAVPLLRLTSGQPAAEMITVPVMVSATDIPAVLRVKLLTPAKRLQVKTADGKILLDMVSAPAGETEHDEVLPLEDDGVDLQLSADFGASTMETAVFLTLLPDGYEEQTRYATGSGLLEETLYYGWHHEH